VRDDYGWWHLDRENLTLTLHRNSPSGYDYEVDLEWLTTSGAMLDIICQIASKTWGTPEVVGTLVAALNDIFHPQANLCSFGRQTTIHNVAAFLRKRLK
jgi:hypothetical protein